MSIDEQHVAMPKLYGAPAYGRPPGPAETVARPFDPDELPIEAELTDEEREFKADASGPCLRPRRYRPRRQWTVGDDHEHGTPAAGVQPARDKGPARPRLTIERPRERV